MFQAVNIKWNFNDEEWNDTVTLSTKKQFLNILQKKLVFLKNYLQVMMVQILIHIIQTFQIG
jgi:hypothetical protein